MKLIAIGFFFFVATAAVYATGGDDYEYQPTLAETLDMLPGKSLGEIFLETSKIPEAQEPFDINSSARDLANRLGQEPLPKLLKAADDLIAQARLHYDADRNSCHFAHDLHDAIAVSADNPAAARDYILWRADHPELADTDLDKRAEAAKGLIKANWLYACGATRFTSGDRIECQAWFDRVVKEFPKGPRAEIAMFMSARCAFSQSRAESSNAAGEAAQAAARSKAVEKFKALRQRYPHGRFDADALGWLGALAYDAGEYLKALEFYIAQAETPSHPETLRTAIYNCEKALAHVGSKPGNDAAFALIARHPRIAMAFTYLVISAPEADNYDGKWDNPADVQKWRRAILPRIAAAIAKQKETYKSGDWQPRYLAMLVHAASGAGNHAQALQLSQISPDQLKQNDDLLFARAVALQRASKTREAIEAYQNLLRTFPKSPLKSGVKIRLALALEDNHQAGEAVALLHGLLPKKPASEPDASAGKADSTEKGEDEEKSDSDSEEATDENSSESESGSRYTQEGVYPIGENEFKFSDSAVYPNLSGADAEQIQQFIDTLMNFAPLAELTPALNNRSLDKETKSQIRAVLAERYLANENFAEAKKYIVDPEVQKVVNRLEQLTRDNSGTAEQKAERIVKLADTWAGARGQLLRAPLDTERHNGSLMPGLGRRDNGRALHLPDLEDQLDDRDELHHASRWWMRAARALPGTPLAAHARWKALEALPQIARASLYAEQRAREIKLAEVSREIYDKLRAESPNSPEAQRLAAYWSVPPLPKKTDETPNYVGYGSDEQSLVTCGEETAFGYPVSDNNAFMALTKQSPEAEEESGRAWNDIEKRIATLRHASATSEVTELSQLVRKHVRGPNEASTANCLDDLAQFLSEPDLPREARDIYVNLRLDLLHRTHWPDSPVDPGILVQDTDEAVEAEIAEAEENPAFKSFHDYLDFCRIGLVAGTRVEVETDIKDPKDEDHPVTYHSRDYTEIEKMARDFLNKYPRSRKREAATFVLARAVYSLSCPYIACVGVPAPGTKPGDGLYEVVQKPYRKEPFKADRVMKSLDDYDRAFPNGRYAGDVRDMRAATLWRMHQWDKALDLTLAQVADKTKPDLVSNAETRLANIFAETANSEYRPDLLAVFRAHPAALPYLQAYLGAATKDRAHPLRYMQRFLADQFHLKIPAPDESVASN